MKLIQQLFTLVKGGVREGAQGIVDANGLRLLDEQIHECEAGLGLAKRELTLIVAERVATERELKQINAQRSEREAQARKALQAKKDSLAAEIAAELATIETRFEAQQDALEQLQVHEQRIQSALRQATQLLRDLQRQTSLVRATHHSQKVQNRLQGEQTSLGQRFSSVQETLARIKGRQQHLADEMTAQEIVDAATDSDSLNVRLRAEGLLKPNHSADTILDRLRSSIACSESAGLAS